MDKTELKEKLFMQKHGFSIYIVKSILPLICVFALIYAIAWLMGNA